MVGVGVVMVVEGEKDVVVGLLVRKAREQRISSSHERCFLLFNWVVNVWYFIKTISLPS